MKDLKFDVIVHVEDLGDVHGGPGEYVGTRGKKKFIEAFMIVLFPPLPRGLGLRYRADIKGSGDTGWVKDAHLVGSRGKRTPIDGFAMELTGARMAEYDVLYMAHIANSGDTVWLSNGDYCGLHRQGHPIEGLAVKIVPRKPNYITLISKAASGTGKALVITAPASPDSKAVLVSAPNGSDLQLWDRRPVHGGTGYALISKARPNLCIARGPGQEAVLKDVALIDGDDSCVWLDDTVPGQWNAIRSRTDLELKLNMRGNPPYADKDNVLIVYPWARASPNELWRQKKATYDLVGGTDDAGLNQVAQAIYNGCYPSIFTGSQRIDMLGIKTVGYNIATAPVFRLQPSALLEQAMLELAAETLGATDAHGAEMAAAEARSSFVVSIERIELIVEGDTPVKTAASLEIAARVRVNLDRSLTLELQHGKLDIAGHPPIEGPLNKYFVPWLLEQLNQHVLGPITIPAIDLLGIEFTTPLLATQHPHLIAATSKVPDTAELPPPSPWPRGKVFVGADEEVLNSVVAAALADVKPSGEWSYGIDIFICDLHLRAKYRIGFANPRFAITPTSGNKYKVQIDLDGHADFEVKCKWSAEPGAGARGQVTATARVEVNRENKLVVIFESLDDISLDWSFNGTPWWMDSAISSILGAFNPVTKLAVTEGLRGKSFEVYTIPTIEANIAGRKFELALRELKLESTADAGHKPLALVTGKTEIKIK